MAAELINNHREIVRVLAKFQAIEAVLKVYIVKHQVELDKKSNDLKVGYTLSAVDELSFGILLKRFKQKYGHIQECAVIYQRLFDLKDSRNFFAHKSFLSESNMPKHLKDFIGVDIVEEINYPQLNIELDKCISLLCSQLRI